MKNNNDNNIKANRKIKQINKVKSFKKKKMKVRATVICYNRYCGSTLQTKSLYLTFKKSLNVNLKKGPLHAHSIHSAGKYPAHVAKRILFF